MQFDWVLTRISDNPGLVHFFFQIEKDTLSLAIIEKEDFT